MNYLEKFRKIHTFIFDIDGVLTSGKVFLSGTGELLRSMSVRDGFAIKVAVQRGYEVAIVSGGTTPGSEDRLGDLGVQHVYLGVANKKKVVEAFLQENNLEATGVLFMGDDLPDYSAMQLVGLPCCPMDAVDEIRELSLYISPKAGGNGCVRDVIEKVLKLKRDWPGYPSLQA